MELEVPDEATHHLALAVTYGSSFEAPEYRAAVRAIAAPVVVADRRRLAADVRRLRVTVSNPAARAAFEEVSLLLDARADELDGGSRG